MHLPHSAQGFHISARTDNKMQRPCLPVDSHFDNLVIKLWRWGREGEEILQIALKDYCNSVLSDRISALLSSTTSSNLHHSPFSYNTVEWVASSSEKHS